MLRYLEEAIIAAPAGTVFRILTDLSCYAQWNPWILAASGTPDEGATVALTSLVGGRTLKVDHRITRNRPDSELSWCDQAPCPALARGETARRIEPRGDGTVSYRVELSLRGLATPVLGALVGRSLAEGLKAETKALKEHAETMAGRAS
jgi:hypothetical protein